MSAHPIFILEGPDACGKTTLANRFVEQLGARRIHLTLRKEMFLYQLGALRTAVRESWKRPVVIDRHWVSENVYAGVYRGGTSLLEESAWMDWALDQLGALYVLCLLRDDDRCVGAHLATHATGREMYEPDDRIRQVSAAYRSWYDGGTMDAKFGEVARVAARGGMIRRPNCIRYDFEFPVWQGREKLLVQYLRARGLEARMDELDQEILEMIEASAKSRRRP